MLSGIEWAKFIDKKDLIKLVCSYFQTDECRNLFDIPLSINSGENIWSIITKEATEVLPRSIGLTFYELINNEAAVIFAKDAGIFLLLIYHLGQLKYFLPP